jgi:mannosyl-oligosaccharide alpha-1,2-mannosidase
MHRLVDALDTLWIMGLRDEFQHGRDWVKANLTHTLIGEVSTFKTTIRSLGGLISAYDLSDDIVFLKQAEYLGPRLFKAFDSPSGLPRGRVNLRTGTSHLSGAGNSYVLAEVASLQLEFNFMAKATGKDEYRTKSDKVFDILKRITPRDGLLPVNLKEKRGGKAYFSNNVVSFGGMGDSAYEYMLKLWLQGGKKDMKYRDMWDKALNGMHHHLLKKSTPNGLTYIADRSNSHVGNEMSHLTCFMAGALALGAYTDPEGLNSPRAERDLKTAKALAYTCYQVNILDLLDPCLQFHCYYSHLNLLSNDLLSLSDVC